MKENPLLETGWNFDNSYAHLPKSLYVILNPTPVPSPKLVILSDRLAAELGLDVQALHHTDGVAVLAGNQVPKGALPLAQAYAGHQFGHFTMLGDGRAILLGEQLTPQGKRYDVQLKGSGKTPFSRRGDGRAALAPMLREYIISEAMYALGIPTTRSLAVVTTGEPVYRETQEPGGILTRIAASHLRVGTFEYLSKWGTGPDLRALADYTLQRHFPDADLENPYLFLLREVIKGQALLIAKWQLVGFIHGVMNTDNMALSGETIDYGPCAFMDVYDPETVFSSIDTQGRYAYGKQPHIAAWNLARFAETLLPLIHDKHEQAVELAQDAIEAFADLYHRNWLGGMRAKLGIFNQEPEDEALIGGLLSLMQAHGADFTNTFRALSHERYQDEALFATPGFAHWLEQWQARLGRQEQAKDSCKRLMQTSNPAHIPRNHRVEEALDAAANRGDFSVMERLLAVLSRPYDSSPELAEYATPPPPSACRYQTFCGT